MKNILGLDLGTTSIGWAFVHEAENEKELSEIIRLGVRVNPLSTDEQTDFSKGNPITVNAGRTSARSARRNLQRYKHRRCELINCLKKNGFITGDTILAEDGKNTTFETLKLRAKAATEKITSGELARVLLTINKKRGYKSSRKAKSEEEGEAIDGMGIAKVLYERNITPGQYCYELLQKGKKILPDFYRSDLQAELVHVWEFQKQFYPEILTNELYDELKGKNKRAVWAICEIPFALVGIKRETKGLDLKIENYKWRAEAISKQTGLEELAVVLQEINGNLYNSSGYLGAISDRSKELYFNKQTVGQYIYNQVKQNPHTRLKGQVFYRQDYLDEFEQIWETQKPFYPQMTDKLKEEFRDIIIFYQRRLKSQKGLISYCEFESRQIELEVDGKKKVKTIGSRVCPKSSPLFQEFKIWQNLSHVELLNLNTKEKLTLSLDDKQFLFDQLNIKGNLKKKEIFTLLGLNSKEWDLNFSELQGNLTNMVLFEAYEKILDAEGYEDLQLNKKNTEEIIQTVGEIFNSLGINPAILTFNAELDGISFEQQKGFALWHLLYSYEDDKSKTGNDALFNKLEEGFGFTKEQAGFLINVAFQDDYGNLSTKAIRKIFPHIKENTFDKACQLAGYNHSHSLTKEENENRTLKDKLELLPKNSLRNPVVEKILNQMVNVINAIIKDENLGKPDEIRIELARELKKSTKERKEMTQQINRAKGLHDEYRKILQNEFGIKNPTRNDIVRYKLYLELKDNGFKTLYTDTYIPQEKLFSKEFDIEHIIPQARLFDDSFSNKTIEARQANIDKADETAHDYVLNTLGIEAFNKYKNRVENLFKIGGITKAKYQKLMKEGIEIGEGFIARDLRESQFIAKKAKQMLLEICRTVVSTSGSVTDTLREDWGLIDTMKELNISKYRSLGLTEMQERKEGKKVEIIKDWTKRNDHRHHAMDALTVAFTKHNHIQYLNNLNARRIENHKRHGNIIAIEKKETTKDGNGRRRFKLPLPNFRVEAKKQLDSILISHKAKKKVVTQNKNKIKGCSVVQTALTPRGQLHKETVYGKSKEYLTKLVKIGPSFDNALINQVSNKKHREAILNRLVDNENNPKKAFSGKNSISKKPIYTSDNKPVPEKVKLVWLSDIYTIRKDITPDLKLDKVVDKGIQKILKKRLEDYNGNAKEAFSNLKQNPIWLNEKKGIAIKRVTITGVSNAEPIHIKKDHFGNPITIEDGKQVPVDYISTGNNHHVAIYRDAGGNLHEEVVSLFEAVARVNEGLSIIKTEHEHGWEFLFTMKQNEMFIFPSIDFDPSEIDLLNPSNNSLISPHLFRVQKLAPKDYWFRHHLETTVEVKKVLSNHTFKRIQNNKNLKGICKVRINHIGQIVQVGEY